MNQQGRLPLTQAQFGIWLGQSISPDNTRYNAAEYLKFEGEEASMFLDKKLPTLDMAIWWEDRQLMFEFYEKEMCPNKVLQRDTALSDDSIRASLNKKVVRRLLCCKAELPITAKEKVFSKFSQKLMNSGFSLHSSQLIVVLGVTRYLDMLWLS